MSDYTGRGPDRRKLVAVSCAVALQLATPAHNAPYPANRAIVLRMGVDLGDVISDEADFHGKGVRRT